MSFYNKVSSIFPGVSWQGQSDIHVSICGGGILPIHFKKKTEIMYYLQQKKVGYAIWNQLQSKFEDFEWLLDGDTFNKLFLVDVGLNLSGKKTSDTPDRIKNPATGSLFHRISLGYDLVGAIRFWANPVGYDENETYVEIGWRVRIVAKKDAKDEENVREESRRLIEEVTAIIEVEYSELMEMKEPPKAVMEELESIHVHI